MTDTDLVAEIQGRLSQDTPPDQKMKLSDNEIFKVTAAQLRACAKKNPKHPHAIIFQNAVEGAPDNHEVFVEKVALESLLENKGVKVLRRTEKETYSGSEQTTTIETKVLGDKLK